MPTAEELAAAHAAHLRELQAAPIVEQLDALQHANEVLQAEVLSTAAALAHSRAEVDRLHSMQAELVRETPDVEAVLATVHAEHEAKSARVLAVLRGKDDEMAALAEENTALRDALAEREAAAEATREGAQLAATNFELLLREKGETAAAHAAQALSLAEARQAAAEAAEKAHGLESALEARDEELGVCAPGRPPPPPTPPRASSSRSRRSSSRTWNRSARCARRRRRSSSAVSSASTG